MITKRRYIAHPGELPETFRTIRRDKFIDNTVGHVMYVHEYYTGHPYPFPDSAWYSVGIIAYSVVVFDGSEVTHESDPKFHVQWNDSHVTEDLSYIDCATWAEACAVAVAKKEELSATNKTRNSNNSNIVLEKAKIEYAKLVKKAEKKGYKSGWVFFQIKDAFGYDIACAVCTR
jgi:hypothetical protein